MRDDDAAAAGLRRAATPRQSPAQIALAMFRQRRADLIWILAGIAIALAFAMFSGNG